MSTCWNAWYAKCPFFRTDDGRNTITCEGITDACTFSLRFTKKSDFEKRMEVFCMQKYENCEVYRMIAEQYEE